MTSIPVGESTTESSTATKLVTFSNYPNDFVPIEGTKFLVKFTNSNTATTQMKLQIGSLVKNCTCRGVSMGAGSVRAGAKIEFTYDGDTFDCQFAEPISSIDTNSASPVNSSAINGALANYDTKGNQSIIAKTDANLCIPSEQTESINYIAYGSNKNLPTNDASYFIRTQRSTSYIVQFASNVQNAFTKTEPDYTRKAKLSGETWTFSPWEKITTETDLNNYNFTEFTKNEDLNTVFTHKGTNVTSTTTSLMNLPSGFSSNVGDICCVDYYPMKSDNARGLQIFSTVNSTNKTLTQYKRVNTANGWSEWKKFLMRIPLMAL